MWDLSPPTRDWTHTLCVGMGSLNHWTTREVPWVSLTFPLFFAVSSSSLVLVSTLSCSSSSAAPLTVAASASSSSSPPLPHRHLPPPTLPSTSSFSFSFTSLSTSCSRLCSLAGASPPFSASSTTPLFSFEKVLRWSCCPQPRLTWWGRPVILCSGLRGKKARVRGGSPESCWRPRQRWLKHMGNQTREQCKDGFSKQPVGQHIYFKQSFFFFLNLAMPCSMWDLSSLTRNCTCDPWIGREES